MRRGVNSAMGLIFLVICNSCTDTSQNNNSRYASLKPDPALNYTAYDLDSVDLYFRTIQIDSSDEPTIRIVQDNNSGEVKMALQDGHYLFTWKLLDLSETDQLVINIDRINFDRLGRKEVVIDYEYRAVYSSIGSSFVGIT